MNPHDAEEVLKPYLGRVFDNREEYEADTFTSPETDAYVDSLRSALNQAMRMLGLVDSV